MTVREQAIHILAVCASTYPLCMRDACAGLGYPEEALELAEAAFDAAGPLFYPGERLWQAEAEAMLHEGWTP